MMLPEREQTKISRRGCSLLVVLVALVVLLLVAIGPGWLGRVDGGKVTTLPVAGGNGT